MLLPRSVFSRRARYASISARLNRWVRPGRRGRCTGRDRLGRADDAVQVRVHEVRHDVDVLEVPAVQRGLSGGEAQRSQLGGEGRAVGVCLISSSPRSGWSLGGEAPARRGEDDVLDYYKVLVAAAVPQQLELAQEPLPIDLVLQRVLDLLDRHPPPRLQVLCCHHVSERTLSQSGRFARVFAGQLACQSRVSLLRFKYKRGDEAEHAIGMCALQHPSSNGSHFSGAGLGTALEEHSLALVVDGGQGRSKVAQGWR